MADITWNETEWRRWEFDPGGEIGRHLLPVIGEEVLARAKPRAERRTGAMVSAMKYEVSADEHGVAVAVTSPQRSPRGFPYPIMHEKKYHPRDRRPHRSLVPALLSMEGTVF